MHGVVDNHIVQGNASGLEGCWQALLDVFDWTYTSEQKHSHQGEGYG